jgi:hypothetical protein
MKIFDGNWWDAANRLYYILHPRNRRILRSYRDRHRGERCFLIGNGPSLRMEDLRRLKDERTMVANSIIKIFPDLDFLPTYYFSQDSGVLRDNIAALDRIPGIVKFIRAHYSPRYHAKGAVCFNMYMDRIAFSPDISRGVYDGWTVMFTMIQFAVYMGFSQIYLLGVDFEYAGNNTRIDAGCYFDKRLFNDKMNYALPRPEVSTAAFNAAKEYCHSRGITICNATRGGKLEVFPRVDLDTLLTESLNQ